MSNIKPVGQEVDLIIRNLNDPQVRKDLVAMGDLTIGTSSKSYNLMQQRMSVVMKENPKRKELEDSMSKIQQAVEELNPDKLGALGFLQELFSKNKLAKKVQKINEGYKSAEERLSLLENSLTKGLDFLQEDNTELQELYMEIASHQDALEKHIAVLEPIVSEITKIKDEESDPDTIIFASEISTKLENFKIIYQANRQFQASIVVVVQGNTALQGTVKPLATTVGLVARSGLMIQTSLMRQKSAINMVKGAKEFVSDMLVSNAKMVQENVRETQKVINSPSIDMDKMREAHTILSNTVREAVASRDQAFLKSRESLEKLSSMFEDLPQIGMDPNVRE